ncbi:MAG TPA: NlpC/P60 family protein, partial [Ilumatobacteraceae bacterium]|nr:NlpC/P60 family protein [Ilumatobacteraceae bacterium]
SGAGAGATGAAAAGLASAGVLVGFAIPADGARAEATIADAAGADSIATLASAALQELASTGNSSAFSALRDQAAAETAVRLGLEPDQVARSWAAADSEHQLAVLTGLTQVGVPYRRYMSKPGVGFDCSGLTSYAWSGAGYALTHQSTAQIRAASPRTFETAQPGDLVQYPGHIMMWLGTERAVLQSPRPGKRVEIVSFKYGRTVKVGDPTG